MRFLLVFLLMGCIHLLSAQSQPVDRSFLSIVVIPYTGPEESVRTTIEKSEVCRAVLGQVNHIFQQRGYRIKDYMAILRLPDIVPSTADLERSEIKEAIKNAKVDIVIYVEIKLHELSEGDRKLELRLKAIDQYSAENYADDISIESTRRRYPDFVQAVKEAQLVNRLRGFADQLDLKFVDILQNGRTVTVKIGVKASSKVTLGTPVDNSDLDLIGTIEQWLRSHTTKVYPSSGDDTSWEAECKLSVLDTNQRTVTPFSFRTDLKVYMQQLRFSKLPLQLKDVTVNSVIEIIVE